MASGSDYAHVVATATVGRVETGGQGAIPEEAAGDVRVLWHHDQVRYVPACGMLSLGFGSVVEGCATRFDGPCSWITQSAGGSPTHQVRNAHTALDGDTAGVYGRRATPGYRMTFCCLVISACR